MGFFIDHHLVYAVRLNLDSVRTKEILDSMTVESERAKEILKSLGVDYESKSECVEEILKSMDMKKVIVKKQGKWKDAEWDESKSYLQIYLSDNEEMKATRYYKENEKYWFNTDFVTYDNIRRIFDVPYTKEFKEERDEEVKLFIAKGEYPYLYCWEKYKQYSEEERIAIFNDIPMSLEAKLTLAYLLESELKEYIIEHFWFDRYEQVWYC